ncbi:MAG: DUF4956 domain-containing protein [Candidatus Ornithomonoglobus sp.]
MNNFNDVFKSSFLEQSVNFSLADVLIALVLSFVVGLFISIVYKKTYSGVMYNASFSLSLIAMSMITTVIILAVTSNIVLSLGMVGALSIVRFRTAIKEPMDIAYLFWSISSGIVLGAGLIPLAVIGSVMVGLIIVIFANRHGFDIPYILMLNTADERVEHMAEDMLRKRTKKHVLKSKNVTKYGTELTYEVRINKKDSSVVNVLSQLQGVSNVCLVSYNGEYMS